MKQNFKNLHKEMPWIYKRNFKKPYLPCLFQLRNQSDNGRAIGQDFNQLWRYINSIETL